MQLPIGALREKLLEIEKLLSILNDRHLNKRTVSAPSNAPEEKFFRCIFKLLFFPSLSV
jgi:hypothetical protein